MMVNAIKKRKKMMEDDTENDSWRVLTTLEDSRRLKR